jgi:prepilin-type processing-associated H-X9-DG protein
MGLIEIQYANDCDGFLALTRNYNVFHNNWFEVLDAHNGKSSIFWERKKTGNYIHNYAQVPLCPAWRYTDDTTLTKNQLGGYVRNRRFGDWRNGWVYPQVKMSGIKKPSSVALTMEGYNYYIYPVAEWNAWAMFPHGSRMNVLHPDGHVDNKKGVQLNTWGTSTNYLILDWRPDGSGIWD